MINRASSRILGLGSPFVVWSTIHGGAAAPIAPTPCRHRAVITVSSPIVCWSDAFRFTSTPIPPPAVLTLREGVNSWLRSLAALTAVVGQRMYKQDPSQMSQYPCLVIELPTRSYGYNLSGHDGTSVGTLKFTAYSSFESQNVAAIEAIRNGFQGFRGMQSFVPVLWCYLDDEEDDTVPPPDGSDQWIYANSVTYRIKHRVPKPTSITQTNV